MNCELYFRIIPEFNFRIVHLGQRIESRNSWAVRTFSHASCFFQRNVKTRRLVSAKLTSLRNGIGFSEIMLFSLISIQLPGIWMNSLSNLTAMKCKPFLISDLFCSSGSDKRVETRHASLIFLKKTIVLAPSVHYVQGNFCRKESFWCRAFMLKGFNLLLRRDLELSGTLCSTGIYFPPHLLVSTQQTSSSHLYWQLIFAPKHKKTGAPHLY